MSNFETLLAARRAEVQARNEAWRADWRHAALHADMGVGWAYVEKVWNLADEIMTRHLDWNGICLNASKAVAIMLDTGNFSPAQASTLWQRACELTNCYAAGDGSKPEGY